MNLNINVLAETHQVYALDMVGFGKTDKPEVAYSFPYLAQFVHDFMEIQGITKAIIVGFSLGGGVTLQFTIIICVHLVYE